MGNVSGENENGVDKPPNRSQNCVIRDICRINPFMLVHKQHGTESEV